MCAQEIAQQIEAALHDQGIISFLVIGATLAGLVLIVTMVVAVAIAPVIDVVRLIA